VILHLDPRTGRVRKHAAGADERRRLVRERDVLALLPHPGLVRLVDAGTGWIELAEVRGWCLADVGPLPSTQVAGIGAAIATVLSDLHDLGVTHGAVQPSHVLLDDHRRPVLCSLGRAETVHGRQDCAEDVRRLARALQRWSPAPGRGHRGRRRTAGRPGRDAADALGRILEQTARARRPRSRELARALTDLPGSDLPGWTMPESTP